MPDYNHGTFSVHVTLFNLIFLKNISATFISEESP